MTLIKKKTIIAFQYIIGIALYGISVNSVFAESSINNTSSVGDTSVIAQTNHANKPQEMRLQSNVQGQQSQPKVLFIVPWEDSLKTHDLAVDDIFISEADFLAPVDRTLFQKTLNMYKQLEKTP